MRFRHYVVTRFSLEIAPGSRRHLDEEWLDDRLALLERWCLPSVRAQSHRDFTWLLLLDRATPPRVVERVEKIGTQGVRSAVHLSSGLTAAEAAAEAIRSDMEGLDVVVTSRLDSDDAIGRHFVEDVQQRVRPGPPYLIRMTRGLVFDSTSGECRSLFFGKSPFVSVVEPATSEITTAYWTSHTEIPESVHIVDVDRDPSWLQVVHGGNVLNRLRGKEYEGRLDRVLRSEFGVEPTEIVHLRGEVTDLRSDIAALQNQMETLQRRKALRLADGLGRQIRRFRVPRR